MKNVNVNIARLSAELDELAFQNAVVTARLLFLAQLEPVADDLGFAILAVLPGSKVALFDGALFGVTALPF